MSHSESSSLVPAALGTGAARPLGHLLYGGLAYLAGVTALVALILASLGVIPLGAPRVAIESPIVRGIVDIALWVAFALQHSVMARPAFKARWTRIVPPATERSTYVLATALFLGPLLAFWQPLAGTVWHVTSPLARTTLLGVAVLGWAYLFAASWALNHAELFGLQQTWRSFRGTKDVSEPFRERWMYRFDRHPIMTGLILGLWSTPDMTADRLLFCVAATLYIVIGVHFEERALRRTWGATYESYRRRVRSIVPTFGD